jgi:hypothetical protein
MLTPSTGVDGDFVRGQANRIATPIALYTALRVALRLQTARA